MRANQYIASASKLSRRAADEAIRRGRVTINNSLARLGATVSTGDEVKLDGKLLIPPTKHMTIMYNKPVKVIVSRKMQGNVPTIYQQLPMHLHGLQPVGRLDKDSSGLLILTDDGALAHSLAHPSFKKLKTYEVILNRTLAPTDLQRLKNGIELEDGISHLKVDGSNGVNLTISMEEGRNRQIRRTFEALDYSVRELHRITFGPYKLGRLAPGEWVVIEPEVQR